MYCAHCLKPIEKHFIYCPYCNNPTGVGEDMFGYKESLDNARRLLSENKYEECIEAFEALLDEGPLDAYCYAGLIRAASRNFSVSAGDRLESYIGLTEAIFGDGDIGIFDREVSDFIKKIKDKRAEEERRRIAEEEKRLREEKERKEAEEKRLREERERKEKEAAEKARLEREAAEKEKHDAEEKARASAKRRLSAFRGKIASASPTEGCRVERNSEGNRPIVAYNGSSDSVILPANATEISNGAFRNAKVRWVYVPESVKRIGDFAFSNCKALEGVIISDSVTELGAFSFSRCESLATLELPAGLNKIGVSAFDGCGALSVVTVAKGNKNYFAAADCLVETSSGKLISGCNRSSVEVPEGVKVIGPSAFSARKSVVTVKLPAGIKRIEDSAFMGCTALEEINIPSGIEFIGRRAFSGCTSLKKITLPRSATVDASALPEGVEAETV